MVCVNCGKNLIRGYAFCMECGSPVPPEVLEEGGMPGRTDDEGRPKPEAESVPKAGNSENGDNVENREKPVSEVRSSMPGIEPLDGSDTTETLVFCPNCGMHMQSDPYRCNKCGMKLVERPKNVPMSAGGVPLMNIDPAGGLGGIGGGLDGISESDIEQISSFMSGTGNIPIFAAEDNSTPDLFGNDISANDFAALSEQLANFSAANEMPGIEAIEAPKHEPKTENRPTERRVDDFNMGGGSAAAVLSDNAVPVIGNYSMDEDPLENVNLDPYKFLDASMEDAAEPLFSKPQIVRTPPPASVTEQEIKPEQSVNEPVFSQSKPAEPPMPKAPTRAPEPAPQAAQVTKAPKAPEPPVFPEAAPVIEETAPVISEYVPGQSAPQAPPAPKAPETANPFGADDIFNQPVPPPMPRKNTDSVQNEAPRGNLFRCRFCGQSMYDSDKFCPNCGASYKNGSASSKGKSKAPLFIGIAAAVIVLAAGGYFAMNILNNGNGGESLPSNSSSTVVSDTSELEESSQTEESTEPESSSTSTTSTGGSTSTGGAPNSSTGSPNFSTGAPPSSTGAPNGSGSSSSTGAPPSSTGAPNGSGSPSSTGAPPSSTGAPNGSSLPSSTGGAPNSTGRPSNSTGASNSSTGAPNGSSSPTSTGGAPSSTGAPSSSR